MSELLERARPCNHDGWIAGCRYCEAQEALALELMGERPEPEPEPEVDWPEPADEPDEEPAEPWAR